MSDVTIDGRAYGSALAPHIEGLVRSKRAFGYDYSQVSYQLWRLDGFCVSSGHDEAVVTASLAADWAEAVPGEGGSSKVSRVSALRQLALHERSMGLDAHVPASLPSVGRPAVYLPTREETRALFDAIDSYAGRSPWWISRGYGVAFRLMRLCGLRISECAGMGLDGFDPGARSLRVIGSKGDKDRLVYMSDEVSGMVGRWASELRRGLGGDARWLFPGARPRKHINKTTFDSAFARFWGEATGGRHAGKAPTPHSLRHAFVTDRLTLWVRQGVDLDQMMPYLTRYLGHVGTDESLYYYHLVEQAMDAVRGSGDNIPEAVPYE